MSKIHVDENSVTHFCVCFASSMLGGVIGAGYALYRGIWKENEDAKTSGNHWCHWDMMFDVLGIVVGLALHVLLIVGWCSCSGPQRTQPVELNDTNYIDSAELTDDGHHFVDENGDTTVIGGPSNYYIDTETCETCE